MKQHTDQPVQKYLAVKLGFKRLDVGDQHETYLGLEFTVAKCEICINAQ